ncbi:hypothetical protein QBC35DRAFT_15232 [Podospora australis]|uniref:Uncharacterized protein n=1 Tax=Podospora australis TaxID=1536484 RepID=A0AAN7ALV9_9PEZI|nr:hypothetical protein QBC35DRAFT_15232 [Podospora australis]
MEERWKNRAIAASSLALLCAESQPEFADNALGGPGSVNRLQDAMACMGYVCPRRKKVLFLGLPKSGKTSIIRCLKSAGTTTTAPAPASTPRTLLTPTSPTPLTTTAPAAAATAKSNNSADEKDKPSADQDQCPNNNPQPPPHAPTTTGSNSAGDTQPPTPPPDQDQCEHAHTRSPPPPYIFLERTLPVEDIDDLLDTEAPDGLVFVIDATGNDKFAEAGEQLHHIVLDGLLDYSHNSKFPVLVLGTKSDDANAAPAAKIRETFEIDSLAKMERRYDGFRVKLFMCSVVWGRGYQEGMEWFGAQF